MDLPTLLRETLSLRAFDSLWFWLILGVGWTLVTSRVMGVPWDLVQRGRASGPEGAAELDALVHLFAHRTLALSERSGVWMLALTCFLYTGLGLAGFFYGMLFAQALFLLVVPMSAVIPLNLMTARAVVAQGQTGDTLWSSLRLHRFYQHVLAGVSILVTALWGTWQMLQGYLPVI